MVGIKIKSTEPSHIRKKYRNIKGIVKYGNNVPVLQISPCFWASLPHIKWSLCKHKGKFARIILYLQTLEDVRHLE